MFVMLDSSIVISFENWNRPRFDKNSTYDLSGPYEITDIIDKTADN